MRAEILWIFASDGIRAVRAQLIEIEASAAAKCGIGHSFLTRGTSEIGVVIGDDDDNGVARTNYQSYQRRSDLRRLTEITR